MNFIENLVKWLTKTFNWESMASLDNDPIIPLVVTPHTMPSTPQNTPATPSLDWSTPKGAYHATRVTCDNLELTVDEKNLICACIFQESRFYHAATNQNKNAAGEVTSTDWGLCQVNDWFHIGPGKDFPSVVYVMDNPDKVIEWMIGMYKHGLLKQWVSFSSGVYKQWLAPNSPMWLLGTTL